MFNPKEIVKLSETASTDNKILGATQVAQWSVTDTAMTIKYVGMWNQELLDETARLHTDVHNVTRLFVKNTLIDWDHYIQTEGSEGYTKLSEREIVRTDSGYRNTVTSLSTENSRPYKRGTF